jgi:hypothetical protein
MVKILLQETIVPKFSGSQISNMLAMARNVSFPVGDTNTNSITITNFLNWCNLEYNVDIDMLLGGVDVICSFTSCIYEDTYDIKNSKHVSLFLQKRKFPNNSVIPKTEDFNVVLNSLQLLNDGFQAVSKIYECLNVAQKIKSTDIMIENCHNNRNNFYSIQLSRVECALNKLVQSWQTVISVSGHMVIYDQIRTLPRTHHSTGLKDSIQNMFFEMNSISNNSENSYEVDESDKDQCNGISPSALKTKQQSPFTGQATPSRSNISDLESDRDDHDELYIGNHVILTLDIDGQPNAVLTAANECALEITKSIAHHTIEVIMLLLVTINYDTIY